MDGPCIFPIEWTDEGRDFDLNLSLYGWTGQSFQLRVNDIAFEDIKPAEAEDTESDEEEKKPLMTLKMSSYHGHISLNGAEVVTFGEEIEEFSAPQFHEYAIVNRINNENLTKIGIQGVQCNSEVFEVLMNVLSGAVYPEAPPSHFALSAIEGMDRISADQMTNFALKCHKLEELKISLMDHLPEGPLDSVVKFVVEVNRNKAPLQELELFKLSKSGAHFK